MTDTVSQKFQIICVLMFLMVGILFVENLAYFRNTMRFNVGYRQKRKEKNAINLFWSNKSTFNSKSSSVWIV